MKKGSDRIIFFSRVLIKFSFLTRTIDAISIRPRQIQHFSVGTSGTTSLHWVSEDSSLVIGTKKGEIYQSFLDFDDLMGKQQDRINNVFDEMKNDQWIKLESKDYKTKYPIYSTAMISQDEYADPYGNFLCFGSGDRWISVWKQNQLTGYEFMQKLGPHTGWVKSLVYDNRNRLLHSIGCNCIETWDCSNLIQGNKNPMISRMAKRSIENSPTLGTTLSSDLLCLCLLPAIDEGSSSLLVSGGVDGRIHMWLSNPTHIKKTCETTAKPNSRIPLHTFLAHNGRVNAIVYSSATKMIITAGNDGSLCAFRVSLHQGFEFVLKRNIQEELQGDLFKITAVVSIQEECERIFRLALGSSKGQLCFVTAEINDKGIVNIHIDGDCVCVADNSMIYSIACEIDNSL